MQKERKCEKWIALVGVVCVVSPWITFHFFATQKTRSKERKMKNGKQKQRCNVDNVKNDKKQHRNKYVSLKLWQFVSFSRSFGAILLLFLSIALHSVLRSFRFVFWFYFVCTRFKSLLQLSMRSCSCRRHRLRRLFGDDVANCCCYLSAFRNEKRTERKIE